MTETTQSDDSTFIGVCSLVADRAEAESRPVEMTWPDVCRLQRLAGLTPGEETASEPGKSYFLEVDQVRELVDLAKGRPARQQTAAGRAASIAETARTRADHAAGSAGIAARRAAEAIQANPPDERRARNLAAIADEAGKTAAELEAAALRSEEHAERVADKARAAQHS